MRDPAPSIRFFEDPVRSPDHNIAITKFFEPHNFAVFPVFRSDVRCKSFLSAPLAVAQLPGDRASLVADSPGGRSPLSPWKIALPLS